MRLALWREILQQERPRLDETGAEGFRPSSDPEAQYFLA
jgi:hypothetical protein